jgi:hypothetical protein
LIDLLPVENTDKEEERADIKEEPQENCRTTESLEDSEEVSIIPKKGYDLSFLDKLEDAEHASPTGARIESKFNGNH